MISVLERRSYICWTNPSVLHETRNQLEFLAQGSAEPVQLVSSPPFLTFPFQLKSMLPGIPFKKSINRSTTLVYIDVYLQAYTLGNCCSVHTFLKSGRSWDGHHAHEQQTPPLPTPTTEASKLHLAHDVLQDMPPLTTS
jgi:hypothetical protein